MAVNSKTDLLTSQKGELIKSFTTFDIEGRVEYIYTAPIDAVHNTPCTVVQYVYNGANTTQILAMSEGKARWDQAYDATAAFTVDSLLPPELP